MKKYILIFIVCSLIQTQSNHIYLELFGPGILGSINYERNVNDKLFFRAGLGGFSISSTSSTGNSGELKITPIILGVDYLIGNKFKFDIGGGLSYWMMDFKGNVAQEIGDINFSEGGNFPLLYFNLGARYQPIEEGVSFKVGVSFTKIKIKDSSGTLPGPYLGIGYCF